MMFTCHEESSPLPFTCNSHYSLRIVVRFFYCHYSNTPLHSRNDGLRKSRCVTGLCFNLRLMQNTFVWLYDNRFQGIPRFGKVTVSKPLKNVIIPFLRYSQFFPCRQRRKVQDSLSCVQWRAHESHGHSPSGGCEAASSQSERLSCV